MSDEELARLRAGLDALADGSADPALRADVARLLDAAVADRTIHPGQAAAGVRALLGPPHFTRGDDDAGGWGYPTLPRDGEEPAGARWFVWLELRGGAVESIGRRAWIAGR